MLCCAVLTRPLYESERFFLCLLTFSCNNYCQYYWCISDVIKVCKEYSVVFYHYYYISNQKILEYMIANELLNAKIQICNGMFKDEIFSHEIESTAQNIFVVCD